MGKIIIELVNGTMLENDPSLPPNLDTPYEIRECLSVDGRYILATQDLGTVYISYSNFKDVYVVTDEIVVVGGGTKYVKLQHVQELIKLFERRSNIPDWEWEKFNKVSDKIKNTTQFLERNAKTKEEL